MTGPLNEIEIGVTVSDDTAAGFASIYSKAMAFRAAMQGAGGDAGGGPGLGMGAWIARSMGLNAPGTSATNVGKEMRAVLAQLRQGGAAHQDLLLTIRQLNAELRRTPASEGGTGSAGAASAASIAAAVAAALQDVGQQKPTAQQNEAAAQAAAAAAGTWISRRLGGAGGQGTQPYSSAVAAALAAIAAEQAAAAGGNQGGKGGGGGGLGGIIGGWLAGRGGGAIGGWLRGGGQTPLFGGAGLFGIMSTIGGLHLLTDAVVEVMGVVIPASIALGAFGAAAVPTVQAIVSQMKNLQTVATALNVNIPGLSGAFTRAADAVKPQVYQLFGDALILANKGGSQFIALATGAGQVLDRLGARFVSAVGSGHGFSQFLKDANPDLAKIGDLTANLGGAVGAVLQVLPGYAQVLLTIADNASKAVEATVQWAKPLIAVGLYGHGALIWVGLMATGVNFLFSRGLPLLANALGNAGGFISRFGAAGEKAGGAMMGMANGIENASKINWAWIAVAAAALGYLVYQMATAKTVAQQFNASLQQTIQNAPITKLFGTINSAQAATILQIAAAVRQLNQAVHDTGSSSVAAPVTRLGRGGAANLPVLFDKTALDQYRQGLAQLNQQYALVNQRVQQVSAAYGGNQNALGLLDAAGITSGQLLDKNAAHWAAVMVQVDATKRAYAEMGQQGGIFGADMNVMNALVNDQYTAMQNLNQQWQTYLGNITTLESNSQGALTAFRQLNHDAGVTGATFTGVNAQSVTLQGDFVTLFNSVQGVISGMRQAGEPTKNLAQYMATLLNPAVHDGALQNAGLRTAIYDMAQQAGYTGPNAIGPLMRWIDRFTTTLQKAGNMAFQASKDIGDLPRVIPINVQGSGSWSVVASGTGGKYIHGATGMMVPGGMGQPQLIVAHGGEAVVPIRSVPAVAPILAAQGVPGFAAGGIVGSYHGSAAGLFRPWLTDETGATVKAIENAVAGATYMGIKQAVANASTGVPGSVAAYAPQMLFALLSLGQPASDLPIVERQMATESMGNPYAVNRSDINWLMGHPSVGLMQVIQGTFDAFAGPYVNQGPFLYGVSTNPLANIFAGLNYALHRYGSNWVNVLGQGHGYDSGSGWLPPGLSLSWNGTGRPEYLTSGGGGTVVIIEVASTGSAFDRFMTSWLQDAIRVKGGGDVQVAFGSR